MKLNVIALSLGLSLVAAAASASVFPGDPINGFDTGQIKVPSGQFQNDWTFTLPNTQEFDVNAFQIKFNQTYNLSGTTLELFKGSVGSGTQVGNIYNVTSDTNGVAFTNLTSGNYYFQIAGVSNGKLGGKYDLQAVAAVPEPGVYALMGIGLVGLIAARRRKSGLALFN